MLWVPSLEPRKKAYWGRKGKKEKGKKEWIKINWPSLFFVILKLYFFIGWGTQFAYRGQRTACGSHPFYHVGLGDQIQIIRFGGRCLSLLSQLSRFTCTIYIVSLAISLLKDLFTFFLTLRLTKIMRRGSSWLISRHQQSDWNPVSHDLVRNWRLTHLWHLLDFSVLLSYFPVIQCLRIEYPLNAMKNWRQTFPNSSVCSEPNILSSNTS